MFDNEQDIKKPQLIIPLKSYQKIMAYTQLATGEITGFADVSYDRERHALAVGEVYLLEQEAGAAHVEMDEDIIADFNLQMIKRGVTQLPCLWWHSHSDMDTFFSGTDDETIKQLSNDSFMVALVVNKDRKMHALLNLCAPIPFIIDNLPINVDFGSEQISEALKKEVERKVKQHSIIPSFFGKRKRKDQETDQSIMYFPKDIEAIKERIKQFGLKREWDTGLSQHVWKNPLTNIIWVDFHDVITDPFADEFDTPETDIFVQKETLHTHKKPRKRKSRA